MQFASNPFNERTIHQEPENPSSNWQAVKIPVITRTIPALDMALTNPLHGQIAKIKSTPTDAIQTYGGSLADQSSKLCTAVLDKVKMSNAGQFGDGINNILGLMTSVDIKALGENKPSAISKVIGFVTRTKTEFMDKFTDVSTRVEAVAGTLQDGVTRMQGEAKWLQSMYDENLEMMHELEGTAQAMQQVFEEEERELIAIQADQTADPIQINDKKIRVDRLGKQADKLTRLAHLTKLTVPEIRAMQVSNYNNSEKFKDLCDVTIPAWKKQISLGLISMRQKQDAELANKIDDASNQFMKQAADMIHDTVIQTAQNGQRSVVDLTTLQHIQNQTIDAVQQVKIIEEKGRQDRKAAIITIAQMNQQLRDEVKGW